MQFARPTPFRAVILDVDGTLVDSNEMHAHAWVETLAEYGYTVSLDRVRRLIGMGGDRLIEELTGLPRDAKRTEQIAARRREIFCTKYLPAVRAFPASRALVQRLRADGFALAIASAANREELEPLLEIAGVAELVPTRTSSSDVDETKPDPEIVHAALQRLGTAPEVSVMIGDTPYDVEAARGAEVATIAFTSGGWSRDELLGAGAIAVYANPADLLERLAESPLARG